MESFVVCIVTKEENRVDSSAIEKTLNRTSFMALSLYASLAKGKNHQNLIENPRSSLLFIMA